MSLATRLAGIILLAAPCARAFYLPGSAPRDYSSSEKVDVFVNALTPVIGPQAKLVRGMHT
jgi:transmembrane 9 superfamily member 2/4